jgi:hypothetical protein
VLRTPDARLLCLELGDVAVIRAVMSTVALESFVTQRGTKMPTTVMRGRRCLRLVSTKLRRMKALLFVDSRKEIFLVAPSRETPVHRPRQKTNQLSKQLKSIEAKVST